MREVDIERTAYPQLNRNITDREIIQRYTLSPEELSLVKGWVRCVDTTPSTGEIPFPLLLD